MSAPIPDGLPWRVLPPVYKAGKHPIIKHDGRLVGYIRDRAEAELICFLANSVVPADLASFVPTDPPGDPLAVPPPGSHDGPDYVVPVN